MCRITSAAGSTDELVAQLSGKVGELKSSTNRPAETGVDRGAMSAAGALEKADGVTIQAANRALARPPRPQRIPVPGFAYLSVAPTLLVVAIVVGGPLVYSFYLSLHRTNPITKKWLFAGSETIPPRSQTRLLAAIGRTVYFAGFYARWIDLGRLVDRT